MSRIRQFLTPGWVLTAVLALGFTYLAFTVLAPWQLGKNADTRERNQQITRAFEVDPVPAADLFPDDGTLAEGTEWRRVTLRGEYLPEGEVLLRNRPVGGSPASHALTPFRADDGDVYLVNRGFESPSDGGVPDMAPAPAGKVDIMGYARRAELPSQTPPVAGGAGEPPQVYSIDTGTIAELTGQPLRHDYVQLSEDQPGVLNAIPLPTLETGPYLAYGVQWIFFGIMAPLALLWFIFAEVRERKRDRAEQEALLAAPAGGTAGRSDGGSDGGGASPDALSDAMRDEVVEGQRAGETEGPRAGEIEAPRAEGIESQRAEELKARRAAELKAQRMAERYGSSGHSRFGKGKDKGERF